ncbi:MAG TPA: tRNA (adenosine(37)-N6)-threonylcarbamoyltransferase complex dimerization subunit type 1 TsaB [Thiobacillaceae bacterium]|nr:tRNA (adenosine(37)-N6)-threonylcarbamoyltransferase complex dimerization subunit type 1 TsaB [Thiobacillaceae bacterium]HNH88178.1 tRNA (adenosine(37)-N6)-threonylcarbamoyltransferase complex dimerization subunit type 1 TsaB [Thiobacillaceae bacterium]HNI06925.1 tRNA (adenosine(37)-N6)-threonylcarbamoyltransferase complex dimerization subunit type 1 TsaB [Thiobacillaceae bacterium]
MVFLALDTATEWCSAALWREGGCASRHIHAGQRHSDLLVPMLMDLLAEAGLGLNDLDGLAYGMGPGSFTGLRVACGVVQGLALGADLPVLGVSTLEALAEEARAIHGARRVSTCLDARMNEVYGAHYLHTGEGWQCLAGPKVCPPEAFALPDAEGFLGAGSGFSAYPALGRRLAAHLDRVDADLVPHARSIAALAAPRFGRGEGLPAETAEPLYIRDKVALKISER